MDIEEWAARSSMHMPRGGDRARLFDLHMPPEPVTDPTSRLNEWRSLFAREPRGPLLRAISVFDPWGLLMRLSNLDGPDSDDVPTQRELDERRSGLNRAVARVQALETKT